jgi:hypothetical protein
MKCIMGFPNVSKYGISFAYSGRTQLTTKSGFNGDVGDCINNGYYMSGISGVFSGDRYNPFNKTGAVVNLDKGTIFKKVIINKGSRERDTGPTVKAYDDAVFRIDFKNPVEFRRGL